jgi:YggT family protein
MSAQLAATILVSATARTQIASYIDTLAYVYTLVIFAYIISTWVFTLGVRVPYNRFSSALLGFLRDVSEPYLRIFRRFLPSFGCLDLSPIVAILVLNAVARIISSVVHG